jgi:hypothetical protein
VYRTLIDGYLEFSIGILNAHTLLTLERISSQETLESGA